MQRMHALVFPRLPAQQQQRVEKKIGREADGAVCRDANNCACTCLCERLRVSVCVCESRWG